MRLLAIILNILLIGLGLLSLVNLSICGVIAGLGAGIINLVALLKGALPDGFEKAAIICNGLAILAGLFSIPTAWSYLLGPEANAEGATAIGLMAVAIITVYVSAGIVTAVYLTRPNY